MDGGVKTMAAGIMLLLVANLLAILGTPFDLPALAGALAGFGVVVAGILRSPER